MATAEDHSQSLELRNQPNPELCRRVGREWRLIMGSLAGAGLTRNLHLQQQLQQETVRGVDAGDINGAVTVIFGENQEQFVPDSLKSFVNTLYAGADVDGGVRVSQMVVISAGGEQQPLTGHIIVEPQRKRIPPLEIFGLVATRKIDIWQAVLLLSPEKGTHVESEGKYYVQGNKIPFAVHPDRIEYGVQRHFPGDWLTGRNSQSIRDGIMPERVHLDMQDMIKTNTGRAQVQFTRSFGPVQFNNVING
ncbi:MAG TPA: hypothetical protein VFQ63_01525 [Patescibacteria group bacterium]|nr:hypothetical protein [Patescibacteria group bacterium]